MRFNQNDLVGKAVTQIATGRVEPTNGGTLLAAAAAIIPRILWPSKPSVGGSGSLVSLFTGIRFAEGTSVGVGQVLEFYINWGMTSVIIGFLMFGVILRWVDLQAANYLNAGDYWRYTCWLLPGMGMLQPGGILTEVVASVAGNIVFIFVLHKAIFERYYLDPRTGLRVTAPRGSRSH